MKFMRWLYLRLAILGAILICASACATPTAGRPLSKDEAIRIADAEAVRNGHGNLKQFQHSPVFYVAGEGRWYVGYRRPGHKFVDFAIDVYDKTRRGSEILAP